MTDPDEGRWRDEQELPLADLTRAMATYSADGQVDDETGGDAGAEAARDEAAQDATVRGGERPRRPSPDPPAGPV